MRNLKPSRYNVVVDTQENGSILLFNTYSTAFCLLDPERQKFLKDTQYAIGELPAADQKAIEQLTAMGFLVEQSMDEFAQIELHQNIARYGNRNLFLTIGPTLNCNMCCPYCFEAERHQSMTPETANKLIHFLKDYITEKKIESVSITWYGGEPLLELRRIQQISNELIPFCEEKDIPYSANIVTNGYCLSRDNAELLHTMKVSYAQITIDGLEETHNARRKLKSGGGSFWPIVNNIEAAKDILPIVVRVNVDRNNMREIDALTDFFIHDMHWGKNPSFYLAPVDKCTESCGADLDACLSPEEFSSLYRKILTKMLEHGITEVVQRNYPSYRATGCASICQNYFVIDANGYFYTCWHHFGDTSKSIGNLAEPDRIGCSGDYLKWLTVPIAEKCKDCVYLPICQGGCPDRRIQNQNQPECRFHTLMYLGNLKMKFQEYMANK